MTTDLLFYHLETRPLDSVLPVLLDAALWTYTDDSFLPHGIASGGEDDAIQPVLLTNGGDNPNAANVRFYVDRATPLAGQDYERLVYIFNGHDPDAVAEARTIWREMKETYALTYWQQDADGRWSKKA